MSTINVHDIASLAQLETSLVRFASEYKDGIEEAQRLIQQKSERIDEIVLERRRKVAALQSACDNADEQEDNRFLQRKLEEAEDELSAARRWQNKVAEVCAEYQRHVSPMYGLAAKHADKSRQFLKGRIVALHNFVAQRPNHSRTVAINGSPSGESTTSTAELYSMPLPQGFKWIPFGELDPKQMQQLPTEIDYRKGFSVSDMKNGLKLLQTRILPEIQKNPNVNLEYFLAVDLAEKRYPPNSLADLFTGYFGHDHPIRVSRYEGDPHFSIEGGLHRIKAAQELGWNAVPGKVVEVRRPGN